MVLVNAYATTGVLASELGIADGDDDMKLERCITVATKQINDICSRRFWQDADLVERTFYPETSYLLDPGDISTATGLVVKLDTSDDGTFDTELTINTDFILMPVNAALEIPVEPFTEIMMLDTFLFATTHRRPSVSVTAKFGYAAIPTDITQACLIQAKAAYKATAGTFTGFQYAADAGIVVKTPSVDPITRGLLDTYMKVLVG